MGFTLFNARSKFSGVSEFFYAAVKFALLSIVARRSRRRALFAHISAITFYVDIAHSIPVMDSVGEKKWSLDFSIGFSARLKSRRAPAQVDVATR